MQSFGESKSSAAEMHGASNTGEWRYENLESRWKKCEM